MAFKLPLQRRQKLCAAAKARYWSNPEHRLACINASRAKRGAPPISDLAEMGDPKAGRADAARNEQGMFV